MIKLYSVFSDGALYQAEAPLSIRGNIAPDTVLSAVIMREGKVFAETSCVSDENGAFSADFPKTPVASFAEYSITVTCGDEAVILRDIMFGELWLASGQSNMELPNSAETDKKMLFDKLRGKNIRVFHVEYYDTVANGGFSFEPDHYVRGTWYTGDDSEMLDNVSALASEFAAQLYDFLNRHDEVPVGFLNASWGGTCIPGWFPRDELEADEYMTGRMAKIGAYPLDPNDGSQQQTRLYNVKIAPLEGVRVRSVIWYQGEYEAAGEFDNKIYADYLRFYHRIYAKRFAADPEHFMVISSLIYPWTYGASGECCVGYLNDAFIDTAAESPDKFAAVPICDLIPRWSYHTNNHPIHPTNKYPLGRRMANIALDNVYGRDWGQRRAARLKDWEICGNRIKLSFEDYGFGLYVDANGSDPKRPIGLYVSGEDGRYLPAEASFEEGEDGIMYAWCDEIPHPKNAAYSIGSMEPMCNIWAGAYPLLPFHTDRENRISIEAKPWYDTYRVSVWASKMHDDVLDLFWRPIWQPLEGSECCADPAFTLVGQSIRIEASDETAESAEFGCYVKSYPYNRLDFGGYSALTVDLFNTDGVNAELLIDCDDGALRIPFIKKCDIRGGWSTYAAEFDGSLGGKNVRRMAFVFSKAGKNYRFVNLERVRLIPDNE